MKRTALKIFIAMAVTITSACAPKSGEEKEFTYLLDEFADLKVMRYQVPGWDELSLDQKTYVYHLCEAAKWGRDIIWDQNCKVNIPLRKAVEIVLDGYKGDRECQDFQDFLVYAKRLFFSNGIHHHYAEDKFIPACNPVYFEELLKSVGLTDSVPTLVNIAYNPDLYPQRRCTDASQDIVKGSGVNFYEGVSREEVENYYKSVTDPTDPHPIAYGLNTKVVKEADGTVVEKPWKVGGIYGAPLAKICEELELARPYAENDTQRKCIDLLVDYFRTGDLRTWDEYNVEWLKDSTGTIDFVNGFIEDYNDPLGRKGAFESYVHIVDRAASERTRALCENAQWFEDNAPIDPRFRKSVVKGVSARVVNTVMRSGDAYLACAIGINLPNADWIRKEHGSKSVTIANITHAYSEAAKESPASTLKEFAYSEEEIALDEKYGSYASEVHTDLHECLGHGSGQLLPGVASTSMGEYSSTLEEARADLFGLYYSADPKLVELGIMPDDQAYKAEYASYIRNGLMVQFSRVELGRQNTEAHMQNRKLIAQWCYENSEGVIEKKVRDGKTYFVVNDYEALRGLFAQLLAEIQRIKSEGDYEAGKALVEKYAVNIDQTLHKEVLERYAALNLKPYGGFINPEIVPVVKGGEVVDYRLEYPDDYLGQIRQYDRDYSTL